MGAWGRRPCAGSAGRGESVGSPAPAEAAEHAELGAAEAERAGARCGGGGRRGASREPAAWRAAWHCPRRAAELSRTVAPNNGQRSSGEGQN